MKNIVLIFVIVLPSIQIFGQEIYIPPRSNAIDSSTYMKYLHLLEFSFAEDLKAPSSANKHNIFIAYHYIGAPVDTILKYAYQAIDYDPVRECESSCKKTSFTYPMMIEKYHKKWAEVCTKCDSIFARFNHNLMDTLKMISENDQKYRKKINLADAGPNSEAWKKQAELDEYNLVVIEDIFSKYGYPGKRLVGIELVI